MDMPPQQGGTPDQGGGGGAPGSMAAVQPQRHRKQWLALFAGILVVGAAVGIAFGVVGGGESSSSGGLGGGDDKQSAMPIVDGVKETVPAPSNPVINSTSSETSAEEKEPVVVLVPVTPPAMSTNPNTNTFNNAPQQGSGMLNLIDKTATVAANGQQPFISSPLLNGVGNGLMGVGDASSSLPDVLQLANTQNSEKLTRLAEKLTEQAAQSEQFEKAKVQFTNAVTRATSGVCKPGNASALRASLAAKCMYIRLSPGVSYNLTTASLNITYPVAIVGDVWNRPTLDGRKTPRVFNVMAGGFLDLQFVRVYRGVARSLLDGNLAVAIGGAALVYPGAGSNFLGCIFVAPRETWFARDIKGLVMFGGQILNLGGLVTLTDCHFFQLSPTSIRVGTVVGGDVLTVIGVTVASGCTHTQLAMAVAGVGIAGLFQTVLGGVGIFSGCIFNRNLGLSFGAAAGVMTHIGGGVGIYSGCVFNTNGGCFAMFGVAVKQFLGAGVLINSGVVQNKNFGANIFCGAGAFITVGAGVNHNSGCNFNLNSGAAFIATSGGQLFLGAGHMSCVGCVFSRTFGAVSAYGLGGTSCTDAGDQQLIGCPSAVVTGVAATAMLSLQYFMAAGYMLLVRSPSIRLNGAFLRIGQGSKAYVAAGNLTVVRCRDTARGFVGFAATLSGKPQVRYFCQGRPYREVKRDAPLLKPPKFVASTPAPKPPKQRHLAMGNEAVAVVSGRKMLFDKTIESFEGTTNACFESVTSTETVGGSLPPPGALATAMTQLGKSSTGDEKALSSLFAGKGGAEVTDCSSPFLGSTYALDDCAIFNSTMTGCAAGEGYLGLAPQDAETCKTGEGHCPLPFKGLVTAAAPVSSFSSLFPKRALQGDSNTEATGGIMKITRADVMITCQDAAPACRDSKALREALRFYLDLGNGAKVAVSLEAGLPPVIAGHLGIFDDGSDDTGSGTNERCGAVTQFHVYVTTKDDALAGRARAALQDFNKPSTNTAFADALATQPGFETLCAIAAVVSFDYSLPLLDSTEDLVVGDTTANAITPAVAVLDGETGRRSLSTIFPGEAVGIKLSKFPSDTLAIVSLQDSTGKVAAEVASFIPASASEVLSWRVPMDVKPGFYVLKASPASNPMIVATSPIIKMGKA